MLSDRRTKRPSPNAVVPSASRRSPPSYAAASAAAEKVADNEDLLTEILLNLPIKSLFRFKSVSKHWLSIISHPQFSSLHRLRHRSRFSARISGLFLTRQSRSIRSAPEFDFVNLDPIPSGSSKGPFKVLNFADNKSGSDIRIVQSCNGLLLCSTNKDIEPRENFVYNPTTKQFVKLPPISHRVLGLSLAFDPSKSPHYKLVCVRDCDVVHHPFQIEIYSSDTRNWRLSKSFYVESMYIKFDGGVFWNGSVHWIGVWEECAYFNVDEERVSLLPMPPIPEDWDRDRDHRYFGESGGHLHLIDHIYDVQTPEFDVYEMEPDHSRWTVKFRVDLCQIPSAFPQILRSRTFHQPSADDYVFSELCIVRGELDEEAYLVMRIPGKILRYNFKTKTFFKLCDVRPSKPVRLGNSVLVMLPEYTDWRNVHQFIESMALV